MLEHDRRILASSGEAGWRTPPEMIRALERVVGLFKIDLAAAPGVGVCGQDRFLGPGSYLAEDALQVPWDVTLSPGFLNPPYSRKRIQELGEERKTAPLEARVLIDQQIRALRGLSGPGPPRGAIGPGNRKDLPCSRTSVLGRACGGREGGARDACRTFAN